MRCQSKLSIKIPKLMVKLKTMQRKFHFYGRNKDNADDSHNRSPRTKRANQFPKKVGSVFSSVFGNNRLLGKYLSRGEKYEAHGGSDDGKEWHITAEASSWGLGNNLVYGDQPIVAPLSQFLIFEVEDTLEPDGADEDEGKKHQKDKNHFLPLSSLLDKKTSFRCETNIYGYSSEVAKDSADVTSRRLVRIKVRSCRLVRVVSRILTICQKLKMARSMKKKVTKKFEQDLEKEDKNRLVGEDGQLCKKRILMGGRCKPLHSSGTLQYDTDGLLIPEIVP